jgi:hypothetical protein
LSKAFARSNLTFLNLCTFNNLYSLPSIFTGRSAFRQGNYGETKKMWYIIKRERDK